MIKLKLNTRQYTTEFKDSKKVIGGELEDILKITFPQLRARMNQGPTKTPTLVYSIPIFAGLNEISISTLSFENKAKETTYAHITSGTIFGDKTDKKIERVIETLGLIECTDRRVLNTVPYSEIERRRKETFCIETADKQTRELAEKLINETLIYKQMDKSNGYVPSRKIFKEITNEGLGKYIEIHANKRAHKLGSEFYAVYLPENKTIEIAKK